MKYRYAHVVWEDSEASNSWTELDDAYADIKHTHSLGIVIKKNKRYVLMALSFDVATESINCFKKIPCSAIKEFIDLGEVSFSNE